jgi:hypothetical protein
MSEAEAYLRVQAPKIGRRVLKPSPRKSLRSSTIAQHQPKPRQAKSNTNQFES